MAKPLHDPAGEFAIVLYDPTIDAKPDQTPEEIEEEKRKKEEQAKAEKEKENQPLVHKSLAEILGFLPPLV